MAEHDCECQGARGPKGTADGNGLYAPHWWPAAKRAHRDLCGFELDATERFDDPAGGSVRGAGSPARGAGSAAVARPATQSEIGAVRGRKPKQAATAVPHTRSETAETLVLCEGSHSADSQVEVVCTPVVLSPRVRQPEVPGYEILDELGRGGMGVVYKARERRLNRLVALKMILAGDYAAPSAAERIRAEAEIVARLQHPNIVRIHATGDCDGRPYVELEYLGGGSLADHLNGTPWAPRDAARLVASLARAMAEAHRLGIIHRDLKPANILLSTDGTPKISDFGLAKVIDNQSELTCTESIVGSPRYMAPEQAIGQPRLVGPAADVYALGSTLYELLTGRPPFVAPTVLATLELVKNTEPVPPRRLQPTLASDLQTICLKCLRKDPGDRYPSAEALADDLTRFLNGEPILARPTLPWERGWKWMRRYPAMTALGVVSTLSVMGALLAGALYCVERTRQHEAVETRIERVHNEVHQFIVMGGEAFRRSDWYGAKTQYSTALALARTEPKLTGLRERVMRSLEQTEAKIAERARLVGVHKDLDETFADLAAVIVPSAEVRSLYSAARLMCLAASALDQNPESSADDWEDAVRYRTDALVLVARSIARIPEDQRSRFWAHVVRSDRALETIRSSKEYVELEARIVALVATDRAAPAERP